tara:strand:- start:131 stop:523 length:393 start_codon:yes stop_codon:yes gene_type:complete
MSTLAVGTIKSISSAAPVIKNSAGVEKARYIKAFVRYDMTIASISSSFGISSMTDNGEGICTANFTTAFTAHDSYAASCLGNGDVVDGAHVYPCTFFGDVAAGSFKIAFFKNTSSNSRKDQVRMWMTFTE